VGDGKEHADTSKPSASKTPQSVNQLIIKLNSVQKFTKNVVCGGGLAKCSQRI